MRKLANITLLFAVLLGMGLLSRPAAAADMTWTMTSDKPYDIQLKFFSRDGDHVWPGAHEHWDLRARSTGKFSVRCQRGEKICYGAWPANPNIHKQWGVGRSVDNGCSGCCFVCGESNPNRELVN